MRKIKIFLASSILDLNDDRIAVGDFIRQLNEIYIDKGLYISLVKCEDYDNAIALSGKQTEYDEEIEDSELCIFLFYRKVGEYTLHELDVAYRAFSEKSSPKIVTYLKSDAQGQALSDALGEIISKLDGEYRHYYNVYSHIDTLKLGIVMQLKMMKLDAEDKIAIKDGVLTLDGKDILSTANIPIFAKNDELASLYAERARLEDTLKVARERYFSERTAAAEDEFFLAASEVNRVSARLTALEGEALSLVSSVAELTSDGRVLTRRQKIALEFFNAGNYQRAQSVLDDEERDAELEVAEKRVENAKAEISGYVEENKLWIQAQRARGVDKDAFEKICDKYKKASELSYKHDLDKTVVHDYAEFLFQNGRNDEAIRVAKQLYKRLDEDNKDERALLVGTARLLGSLYCENKHFRQAERVYMDIERICDMREADEKSRLWDDAFNHLHLSNFYASFDNYEKALKYSISSINAYKKILKSFGHKVQSDIALASLNLGRAFLGMGKRKEAVEAFIEGVRYIKPDAQRDFSTYGPILARLINNLSITYYDMCDAKSAKQYAIVAVDLFSKLENKNPEQYRSSIAVAYTNLAMVNAQTNDAFAARAAFDQSIRRYEILIRESFDAYAAMLAVNYVNLGELQRRMLMPYESIESSRRAIELCEKLHENNSDAYTPNQADAYNNLGAVYLELDEYELAKEACEESVRLYGILAKEKGGVYYDKLMTARINLATANLFLEDYDTARATYEDILDFFDANPDYNGVAVVCDASANYGMCMIAMDADDCASAKCYINRAVEIYEKIAKAHPELYMTGLADAYGSKATVYLNDEDYGVAIPSFLDAISMYESLMPSNPIGMGGKRVTMMASLSSAYFYNGQQSEAEQTLDKTLDSLFALFSDGASNLTTMLYDVLDLAKESVFFDRADEFYALCTKCVERLDEIFGENSQDTLVVKTQIRDYL